MISDVESKEQIVDERKKAAELTDDSFEFISAYTKTPNIQQLREHVISLKESIAEQLHVYRCIEGNMFLNPRIMRHATAYNKVKQIWEENYKNGQAFKFADVGCCFGTDTRKLLLDGVRPEDVYAIDIHDGYWNFGYDLFKDKDTLKVNTLFTDVSVPEYAETHADLINKFNVVYTGAVLHVFAKDEAETFVRNIFKMLVSGGVYFGSTGVAIEPTQTTVSTPKKDKKRFLHSPDSLEELFKEVGFVNIKKHIVERPSLTSDIPNLPMKQFCAFIAEKP